MSSSSSGAQATVRVAIAGGDSREVRELEGEASAEVWEQKNDALRRLGLRTIPTPGE